MSRRLALTLLAVAAASTAARAQTVPGEGAEQAGPAGALLLAASMAAAEDDEPERIPARVTSVSVGSVFLDVGHLSGVEPGDEVWVRPLGATQVRGEVAAVSSTSCRVTVPTGSEEEIAVGDEAEVVLPPGRGAAAEQDAGDDDDRQVPEHPPWTHPPEEWEADMPLLAAARATPRAERPLEVRGRVFGQYSVTDDREPVDRRFSLGRLGAEAWVENPFDRGGTLHVDGEVFQRETSVDGGDDDVDQRGRLDRFSYTVGGTREQPVRWQFGRFLQHAFPELGLVDGVEMTRRLESGDRIGFSAGFQPVPRDDLASGDDAQVAFTWRADGGGEDPLALGLAVQATWHEGEPDRQLVVGTADWTPHETFGVYGTAWVDLYGGNDEIKDSGPELTELRLSGRWRHPEGHTGAALNASRIRFPELLRDEFDPLTAAELLDKRTDRVGVSAWHRVTRDVRVDGRVDRWTDEDDSGVTADARVSVRDWLWERGRVFVQLFTRTGGAADGTGLRVGGSRSFDGGAFSLTAEQADFDLAGGADASETQRVIRGNLDLQLSPETSLSLWAEERFADLDATTLGALWQRRF